MLKKRSFVVVLAIVMVLAFSVGICAAPTFTDIADSWAKDSIEKMAEAGVVNGYPDGTFRPNGEVTRAEFAQILYNAVGEKYDVEKIKNPFVDVKSDWYYVPVITLYNDGVINGVTATQFDPNAKLTREQMITMVSRAADIYDCFELTADTSKDIKAFKDADQISSYAVDGFTFGYQTGLINGMDGALAPKGITTRAQVVTVLDRCISAEKVLPLEIAQEDWVDAKQYAELSTGITMAYVEMGQADGEPVILLHGITDSSRTWSITAKELAKDFHVYILDQRGSGNTDAPDNRAYSGMLFANDVAAFMNHVGLEKANIVGHSMGSHNAQYFAALFPEKVDKLILVGSAYLGADGGDYFKSSREGFLSEDFDPTDPEFLDNWDYVTPGILDGKDFEEEVEEMMVYIKDETSKISRFAFTNPPTGAMMQFMTNAYDMITAPTLIVCGESDAPNQPDLMAALPNCDGIIVYPGHNHSVQWENPYELGKDIAKYFKGEDNDKIVDEWIPDLPDFISQEDWNGSKKYAQLSTGITMAYIEMGDAKGEPVVMIHGGGGDSSRTFSLMTSYFAEAGYHVYSIDRKGNGDSSRPKYADYDMWSEASDVAAFIDAMGYEKAHIIGHSMGAAVCEAMLYMYPDKIDKLVDYPGRPLRVSEYEPMTEADLTEEYYASWIYNEVPESEWTDEYRNFLEWEIFDAKRVSAEDLNRMSFGSSAFDNTIALRDSTKEHLFIWGTLDYHEPEYLEAVLQNEYSKFLVYPGVGHNIQWEIPEQLANDIMAYFEDKEPPTGYADKDRFLNDPTKVYDMDGDLLFDFTAVND